MEKILMPTGVLVRRQMEPPNRKHRPRENVTGGMVDAFQHAIEEGGGEKLVSDYLG